MNIFYTIVTCLAIIGLAGGAILLFRVGALRYSRYCFHALAETDFINTACLKTPSRSRVIADHVNKQTTVAFTTDFGLPSTTAVLTRRILEDLLVEMYPDMCPDGDQDKVIADITDDELVHHINYGSGLDRTLIGFGFHLPMTHPRVALISNVRIGETNRLPLSVTMLLAADIDQDITNLVTLDVGSYTYEFEPTPVG